MAVDGEIDYSSYTRAQIDEALAAIDPERFPLNHARLLAAQAAHGLQDVTTPGPSDVRLDFRGSGAEYFRIWIVNLALTIVTIGIYSAWAKVRKLRYFYGNTFLADTAFGYHADPLKILKGRAIAAVFVAIYFVAGQFSVVAGLVVFAVLLLAMPWLLVKSRLFSMRMTSWRGLRFDFAPDYAGAYRTLGGWGLASVATLGLLTPMFLLARYRFIVSRTRYAGESFECEPSAGRFFKTALIAGALVVVALIAFSIVAGVAVVSSGGADGAPAPWLQFVPVILFYVAVFPLLAGYTTSRNLNEVFRTTTLGPHRFRSELGARRLAWLYFSNVALIIVTLGLYTPWAQIRMARYRVETLTLVASGSLDEIVAAGGRGATSATGEEISDLFDVDFGL